jgi:hypothetical protein
VAPRNNEKVTRAYWITVPNTVTDTIGKDDALRREGAKRTITMVHESYSISGSARRFQPYDRG